MNKAHQIAKSQFKQMVSVLNTRITKKLLPQMIVRDTVGIFRLKIFVKFQIGKHYNSTPGVKKSSTFTLML